MTATAVPNPTSPRTLVAAAVVPVVALGVIVTAVLVLLLGLWGLLLGIVVTVAATALRARQLTHGVRRRVLEVLDVRPADPAAEARLFNLADGLAATSGAPVPDLFVVDEPAANLMLVGEPSATPALVVTSGLLEAVDRVQLEGAVAWAFAVLRRGDLPAASVAVGAVARPRLSAAAGGVGSLVVRPFGALLAAGHSHLADPERDLELDRAAVGLTRYPPGLRGALEQMERTGTAVARPDAATAHLWMADPGGAVPGLAARPSLELRIEALRLL